MNNSFAGFKDYKPDAKILDALGLPSEQILEAPEHDPIDAVYIQDGTNAWIVGHVSGKFSTTVYNESEYGSFDECKQLLKEI